VKARPPNEFQLIERLQRILGPVAAPGERSAGTDNVLLLGPGDDAAVWRAGGRWMLATTDTMVAGVHFLPGRVAWRDVGWKALASNVSDIAAMGGTPTYALVTLCIPPGIDADALDELYLGLRECAEAFGVSVVGGDVVAASEFVITVALSGEAEADRGGAPLLLRRDAARAGDVIAVTGSLGGSAAGLRTLHEGAVLRALIDRHMRPQPRIQAGSRAPHVGLRCGIDISDGLVQDLGHVCRASLVAAEISAAQVPVDEAAASAYPADALMMALTGGEDYELALVGDEAAIAQLGAEVDVPITVCGRIVTGEPIVRVLDESGAEMQIERGGWDHLR
jgi:thiamine-monophosphate kinase